MLEVIPQTNNLTLVRGQAYIDIRIGRILFVKIDSKMFEFEVISISTYGQKIDELNYALTGELIIEGHDSNALKEVGFLLSQ